MRRLQSLSIAIAILAAASSAFAKSAPAAKSVSTVLVEPVAVPIIVNGQLANYIYVTFRLQLSPKADAEALRNKEPFFRDALIHDAFRTPLQKAGDPNTLDEAKTRALVLRESVAIAGAGMVTGLEITRAQPQHYLSRPAKAAPPPH